MSRTLGEQIAIFHETDSRILHMQANYAGLNKTHLRQFMNLLETLSKRWGNVPMMELGEVPSRFGLRDESELAMMLQTVAESYDPQIKLVFESAPVSVSVKIKPAIKTYFIQTQDGTAVKIGRTAVAVKKRLQSLQTSSPTLLRVVLVLDGDHEQFLHRRFQAHRLSGEWFRAVPEIVEFMQGAR